jgi:hypothetical protein
MDIIQEFLNYIQCKYEKIYTAPIQLVQNETSYSVYMALNNVDKPLCIGGDFETDQQFLDYLKKEFDARKLYNSLYFVLRMETPLQLEEIL